MLSALNGWAVNAQTYLDPTVLPAAFAWVVERNDYYRESNTADTVKVNTQSVEVIWEPDYVNEGGSYGRLTLKNFYNHSRLKKVCDLVFDNMNHNCNFQWKDNYTKCEFSLTPYYFSDASNTNGGYNPSAKYALVSSAQYNTSGSNYWLTPNYATYYKSRYIYGGGSPLSFEIDIVNRTLTILNSNGWGVFMLTSSSGGTSYVLEAFALSTFEVQPPTPLAEIEQNGVVNKNYIVADQLVGVYAKGGSLWCKDQGNVSIEKSTNPGNPDYMRGLVSSMYGDTPEWDQSNWVELDFGTVTNARAEQIQATYVGQTIKAGSVRGKYVDNLNHRIVLSADPVADGDLEYIPNYYCPVNFMGQTQVNTDSGTPYYFLNPKSQEYAMVTMAVWNGNDVFVVPAKDIAQGVNTAGFNGSFTVDWDLNILAKDEVIGNLRTDRAYKFQAILRRNQVQTPSDAPLSDIVDVTGQYVTPNPKYVVCPLDLRDTSVITAITDVRSEREAVGDGYYYNLAGQRVTNPGPGFYIHNGKKVIVR